MFIKHLVVGALNLIKNVIYQNLNINPKNKDSNTNWLSQSQIDMILCNEKNKSLIK